MAKRALPLLTGGLNDVARSDLIDNSQLQECLNYEISGDGVLKRRTEQETFDGYLNIKLSELFDNVKVISEPYYFVTDIDLTNSNGYTLNSDFILLAFGIANDGTYEMHTLYKVGEDWTNAAQYAVDGAETNLNTLLTEAGIAYTSDSDVQFVVSDDRIIITDNVNNAHFVTIDIDGLFRAGKLGMPAPKNKARVEHITEWDSSLFEETSTDARLSQIGLFQCTYTAVTKSGDESNPSPLSDTLDMQFFKIDANGADERWIDKVSITGLSVPDISENDLEDLKYFKVYMRVMRYSEGDTIQTLDLTEQFEIIDISSKDGTTGNSYTLTVEVSAGNTVNYENDVAPIARTAASLGGITMVGNVQSKIKFPHEFKYYHPITISNKDNKHYVDAVVKIRLWGEDSDNADAIKYFAIDDFFESGEGFSIGDDNMLNYTQHMRFYDEDTTTPIMVAWKQGEAFANYYVDLYIKVPLLVAGSSHVVYLCWTDEANMESYDGVPDVYNNLVTNDISWDGNIGIHYGLVMQLGYQNFNRQQVWNNSRVRDTSFIVSPQEFSNDSGALNKANTNINGELTDFYSSTGGLSSIPQLESFADYKMGSSSYAANNNTGNIKYDLKYTDSSSQESSDIDFTKGFISTTISIDKSNFNGKEHIYLFNLFDTELSGTNPYNGGSLSLVLFEIPDSGNLSWAIYESEGSSGWTVIPNMPTYANSGNSGFVNYNLFWTWDFDAGTTMLVLYDWGQEFSYEGGVDSGTVKLDSNAHDFMKGAVTDRIDIGNGSTNSDYGIPFYIDNIIVEKGTYVETTQEIFQLWNFQPMYDDMIGEGWLDNTYNNNIDFDETKEIKYKSNRNMVKWTDVNAKSFPDLFFKKVREPVIKIMPAPSFLQFEYQNTFIIFTRNSINRFVLQGSASGWSGSSNSLIEEKQQYGLLSEKSLVRAGDALFWLSEVGVVKWDGNQGLQLITKNIVDVPIKSSLFGYYVPLNNQYVLHDTSGAISYVYQIDRNAWTKFSGLDVKQSVTLTGGSQLENINLYLKENSPSIDSYPTDTFTTSNSNIKTKNMFFEKGTLKRMKADYTGDSNKELQSIVENMVGAEKTHSVSSASEEWRGVPLGKNRGKSVSFNINNADTISAIMYELDIESEVKV